jgi:carbohydrate-binding DOMON domain-containing protein
MFQNSIQHHNSAHNMVLGCFVGVMILLAIIIILLAFSDNRISNILSNQNKQMGNLYDIGVVLGAKHLSGKIKNKGGFLSNTSTNTNTNTNTSTNTNTNTNTSTNINTIETETKAW